MKGLKRLTSMLIAGVMMLASTAIQASAIENEGTAIPATAEIIDVQTGENGETITTYEMEVTPEMAANGGVAVASTTLDQSFNMTTSHRGADRKYPDNYLSYSITVTDVNGNAVNNTISVQLWDYNHGYALVDTRVDADGSTTTLPRVSITANRTYYFKYVLTAGTTRTLRVRMQIYSYS